MQVYEKRPSGLSIDDLRAFTRRHPGEAAFTALRAVAGLVMFAFFDTPPGVLLFLAGLALLASTVPTLRRSADEAMVRPCLVLTNQPKWDGVLRKVWRLDAGDGDVVALGRALAEALDAELDDHLTTFDELGEFRGDTRNAVFSRDAHAPGQVVWAVEGRPSITPSKGANGVWMRIERVNPDDPQSIGVTVVSNAGGATEALTTAAARTVI